MDSLIEPYHHRRWVLAMAARARWSTANPCASDPKPALQAIYDFMLSYRKIRSIRVDFAKRSQKHKESQCRIWANSPSPRATGSFARKCKTGGQNAVRP